MKATAPHSTVDNGPLPTNPQTHHFDTESFTGPGEKLLPLLSGQRLPVTHLQSPEALPVVCGELPLCLFFLMCSLFLSCSLLFPSPSHSHTSDFTHSSPGSNAAASAKPALLTCWPERCCPTSGATHLFPAWPPWMSRLSGGRFICKSLTYSLSNRSLAWKQERILLPSSLLLQPQ